MATNGYGGSIGAQPTAQQQQQVGQWPEANAHGKPYPEMPTAKKNEPLLTNLGATGTAIYSGVITSEEYNPDFYWRDGIVIYDQMLRSESQVQAIRNAIELPIRRATWSIQPGSDDPVDIEIASFVESCLFHEMCYTTTEGREIRQKWDDTLRHILMHLWYGFMAFELVWRKEDGWIKWARWTPLLPRTVWRWWVGEDNELVGIQQWTFKNYNYQFVDIPVEKLLLFAHRQEGNNYDGVSALRQAYKNWWYVQQFEKIEAIAEERNAVSIPVIYLPDGYTAEMAQVAQTIVQNMRANEQAGVVLPHTMPAEYLKNQQKYAAQVQPSIQYHQAQIARSILADFLQSTTTGTGSYAQTSARIDFFLLALQTVCEYIEDVINNDAIRQLVDYNFAGVAVYPKLKASKLTSANVQEVAAALQQLAAGQFMTPSPETEDWLRDLLGAPATPASAVQATNPGAPSGDGTGDDGQGQDDEANQEPTNQNGSPVGGQGESAADGAALREIREEAELLRLALSEARGMDAVERALERDSIMLENDNPRGPHGHWGEGRHPHESEEEGGGGGGGGSSKGGAAKTKAAPKSAPKAKGPSKAALAKGKAEAEEMHAKSPAAKSAKAKASDPNVPKVKVKNGESLTVTHTANGVKTTHVISPDTEHGGYHIATTTAGSKEATHLHGLTKAQANQHLAEATDHKGVMTAEHAKAVPAGVQHAKMAEITPGMGYGYHYMVNTPKGPVHVFVHPDNAQLINQANHQMEPSHPKYDPENPNYHAFHAEEYNAAGGTWKVNTYAKDNWNEKTLASGLKPDEVTAFLHSKYKIGNDFAKAGEEFQAEKHAAMTPKGGNTPQEFKAAHMNWGASTPWGGTVHVPDTMVYHLPDGTKLAVIPGGAKKSMGYAITHLNARGETISTAHAANAKAVNEALTARGITNKFSASAFANSKGYGGSTPAGSAFTSALPAESSYTATYGSHGFSEGRAGAAPGEYEVHSSGYRVTMRGTADGELTLHYESGAKGKESGEEHVKTLEAARDSLTAHGITDTASHDFAAMALHDADQYLKPPTAAQEARITATDARRSELDAKYGDYSDKAARAAVKAVYTAYPELRTAIDKHLGGGPSTHLTPEHAAGGNHKEGSKEEKLAHAREGMDKLAEISEWSLLHSPSVTREGTIRLFHGANGKDQDKWGERLNGGINRGTPFTSHYSVAQSFAKKGLIVSAHVPASAVMIWHGIWGDQAFATEREYTADRNVPITDHEFLGNHGTH